MAKATENSETTGATATAEKPKREATPGINVFELKDKGSEYPARFGGHEIRYNVVKAGETPAATLETFLSGFVAPDLTPAQQAEVLADYLNGYGLTYSRNGVVKRVLDSDKVKDLDVAAALQVATDAANAHRVGAVVKREGGAKKATAKVAELTASLDAAKNSVANMYRKLSPNNRKLVRADILSDGSLTEAELDAIDAEK